jgi:hypothetical protein
VPANPFMLVAVIVELCVAPAGIVRDAGLAARLKSGVEARDETEGAFCETCIDVAGVDGVATNIKEISANKTTIFPRVRR